MAQNNPHTFALHYDQFSRNLSKESIIIDEQTLFARMTSILRMQVGDQLVLFDRTHHGTATITQIEKKKLTVKIVSTAKNNAVTPEITFLLPVLKRDDLEDAVYQLAACAVTNIQLVHTQKSARIDTKGIERLEKICIAAAEQSKNFALPTILAPKNLEAIVTKEYTHFVFFDPEGQSLKATLEVIEKKSGHIGLMVGPEGDLTQQEKALLVAQGCIMTRLTPTILKASQAAGLAAGIVRSYSHN